MKKISVNASNETCWFLPLACSVPIFQPYLDVSAPSLPSCWEGVWSLTWEVCESPFWHHRGLIFDPPRPQDRLDRGAVTAHRSRGISICTVRQHIYSVVHLIALYSICIAMKGWLKVSPKPTLRTSAPTIEIKVGGWRGGRSSPMARVSSRRSCRVTELKIELAAALGLVGTWTFTPRYKK